MNRNIDLAQIKKPVASLKLLIYGLVLAALAFFAALEGLFFFRQEILATLWPPAAPGEVPRIHPSVKLHPDYDVEGFEFKGDIQALAFSPDGKYLVAGSKGIGATGVVRDANWVGNFRIWDTAARKEIKHMEFRQWIHSLSFTPDGEHLAVASCSFNIGARDGFMGFQQLPAEIQILAFPELREVKKLEFSALVLGAYYSPNGKTMAVVINDELKRYGPGRVALFDTETWHERDSIPVRNANLHLAFSKDSQRIVISDSGEPPYPSPWVKAYEVATANCLATLKAKDLLSGYHMELTTDQEIIILGMPSYDLKKKQALVGGLGQRSAFFHPEGGGTGWFNLSTNGRYVVSNNGFVKMAPAAVTTGKASKIIIEDLVKKERVHIFEHTTTAIGYPRVVFSPNNTTFAAATSPSTGIHTDGIYRANQPLQTYVLLFTKKGHEP